MIRRVLKWRRLRWFAVGAVLRFVVRRTASRSVDQATADIEDRLPPPVRRALDMVPADAVRAGGSAVVAARTARRVAAGSRRASRLATDGSRRVAHRIQRVRSIGDEIGREAELKRRELKAEYLRVTRGNAAADDALLDLRADELEPLADWQDDPPEVTAPIRPGRWRAEKRLGPPTVDRVQRTYRPRSRPWDR